MSRDIAIDYLRSSVTVSVVAHHSALAYTTFSRYNPADYTKSSAPVVDAVPFMPLDILVGWNDLFFMALMFLISGLFVGPSVERKGPGRFLADRAGRLGIPFAFSAVVLSPLAYYPSWRLSDSVGAGHFLDRFFTTDGWQAGPAWFIWVLLAFCFIIAAAYKCAPNALKGLSWCPGSGRSLVAGFLALCLITIVPAYAIMPEEWFHLAGPLYVPAQRTPLYLALFVLGVALGNAGPGRSLSRENLKTWPVWLAVGALSYAAHGILITEGRVTAAPPWALQVLLSIAYALCCTFTGLGALGLARFLFRSGRPQADRLSESAYGIYIFHYGFVTWLQFGLLAWPIPAVCKFFVTFFLALAGSWALTALLRRTAAGNVL